MSLGGLDTAMPPQFEQSSWGSTVLHLPGTEDFPALDDFSIFEELNLNFDESPLFDHLLPETDLAEMTQDIFGPHQVRHDCMWAGTCVEDKERPNPQDRLQEVPIKAAEAVKEATPDISPISVPQCRAPSVKLNNRSILRTNRNLSACSSDPLRTAVPQDDSDDSGRPETPQSMSSDIEAEKNPEVDLSSSINDEDDSDDDDYDECMPVSDVTGQTVRTSLLDDSYSRVSRFDSRPANHFFNDHSYHLSKSDVSASIPGNLTPSDSEDEIDVVSVSGEKGSSSRSSSQGGALPTNPSARDRHALQQTITSAMKYERSYYLPQPSGKLARMQAERQRQRKRRRGAQERGDSSEEDTVRPSKKRAKLHHHHHHKHAAKRGHHIKMSSSDSEPDSCEKRSLHNNMERQRRVDLRNAFEDLRVVVPKLSTNARAAKVVILKEASHFCHQLTADCKSLQQESNCLERERERLMARVSFLRKQVASMRMGM